MSLGSFKIYKLFFIITLTNHHQKLQTILSNRLILHSKKKKNNFHQPHGACFAGSAFHIEFDVFFLPSVERVARIFQLAVLYLIDRQIAEGLKKNMRFYFYVENCLCKRSVIRRR